MNPLFMIGSQRSGTTLLRLMLNAHPEVAIPEEGTFWMPLLRQVRLRGNFEMRGDDLRKFLLYIQTNSQFKLWDMDPTELFSRLREQGKCTAREIIEQLYICYAENEEV